MKCSKLSTRSTKPKANTFHESGPYGKGKSTARLLQRLLPLPNFCNDSLNCFGFSSLSKFVNFVLSIFLVLFDDFGLLLGFFLIPCLSKASSPQHLRGNFSVNILAAELGIFFKLRQKKKLENKTTCLVFFFKERKTTPKFAWILCCILDELFTFKTIVPASALLNFIMLILCCECEYAKFHIKFQRWEKNLQNRSKYIL